MSTVLLVGSGARESALAWKLSQCEGVAHVLVAPGNAGIDRWQRCSCVSDLKIDCFDEVSRFCKRKQVGLVVIGPEVPLANGMVDVLETAGIACFGPSKEAALIEASKSWAHQFMVRHGIPTARFASFTDVSAAVDYIRSADHRAWVIKEDGLAAGKGVTVAGSVEEACAVAAQKLSAGQVVLVEELLQGEECSALCFTDGHSARMMPLCRDYKRVCQGDSEPMTGGMGIYCPIATEGISLESIEKEILQRCVDGLRLENRLFKGVLFAGLMLTAEGPKVLEFNCRLGDPETQALLPLLSSDLLSVLRACVQGTLQQTPVSFSADRCAVGVVLASGGYPAGPIKKGCPIEGLERVAAEHPDVLVFHADTKVDQSNQLLTNSGRVLCVLSVRSTLAAARAATYAAVHLIHFDQMHFRSDIAAVDRSSTSGCSYERAGVSIARGNRLVDRIKAMCALTSRPGADVQLGDFGASVDCAAAGYPNPIMICGTDGVGTKLMIAQECGKLKSIGIDLVAMSVNDILTRAAEPLAFLDYFACGQLDVDAAADVISGIKDGCLAAGCALIGGETAEMPGLYAAKHFDLAGFAVGAIDKSQLHLAPDKRRVRVGQVVLGMSSSGLHSNGFSLVRSIVRHRAGLSWTDRCPWQPQLTLGDALLTPTRIYARSLLPALRSGLVHGCAHITGGGLLENIPRVLSDETSVRLDAAQFDIPLVFKWLFTEGAVNPLEMARVFNLGVGMVLIVDAADVNQVMHIIDTSTNDTQLELRVHPIGSVVAPVGASLTEFSPEQRVQIDNLEAALALQMPSLLQNGGLASRTRKRVAVLISGSGSNLQALIDYPKSEPDCAFEVSLVISNVADVFGLSRARQANIPCQVIPHQQFKTRDAFDDALHECLLAAQIDLVCLAGFMRILTAQFCNAWLGRMLNVHPSILPAFKGAHSIRDALAAGVQLTGCTVHFVVHSVDSGGIVLQRAVPVEEGESEQSLREKIQAQEHLILPAAVQLLAAGHIAFDAATNRVLTRR